MKSLDNGETPKRVVRVTDDLWDWADERARELGTNRSQLIRDLMDAERQTSSLLDLPGSQFECPCGDHD